MHGVGVVPQDAEVGPGAPRQVREALDDLVRVDVSGRIRVFRHAPDALDARIVGHERFDPFHVGAAAVDRDVDQLEAEALGDHEVPVVAGYDAQKLERPRLAPPRGLRTERPVQPGVQHVLVHEREAGVPAGDGLSGRTPSSSAPSRRASGMPGKAAVVSDVRAVVEAVVVAEGVIERVRQRHLLGARLPARQIEREPRALQRFELPWTAHARALRGIRDSDRRT